MEWVGIDAAPDGPHKVWACVECGRTHRQGDWSGGDRPAICPYDDKEIVGPGWRWPEEVGWLGKEARVWCSEACCLAYSEWMSGRE